ncbi:hypothetical protein EfmAA610_07470 [Enterococcus faecium]|nr:hypothetical protein EfmAA610_07470 [Enterococcus faecium]
MITGICMVVALIGPIGIKPKGVTANKIKIAKNIAVNVKFFVFFISTPFSKHFFH